MKTFFIFIILYFSFVGESSGQQTLPDDSGFTDKSEAKNLMVNGVKEGKWVEYVNIHKSGKNEKYRIDTGGYKLILYKIDKPFGIVRMYQKKGKLISETPYSGGKANGIEKEYDEDGKLWHEINYNNDKFNGIWKEFYGNGSLKSETKYQGGQEIITDFYEIGKIMSETTFSKNPYKNGPVYGITTNYNINGNTESEYPWLNGKIDGIVKNYYEDGKLKSVTFYKNGKERKIYNFMGQTIQDTIQTLHRMLIGKWIDTKDTLHLLKISEDTILEIQKSIHVNHEDINLYTYEILYGSGIEALARGYLWSIEHNQGLQILDVTKTRLKASLHHKFRIYKKMKVKNGDEIK